MLDSEGALPLLRRAVETDPGYFPAAFEYQSRIAFNTDPRRAYRRRLVQASSPFVRCLVAVLDAPNGYPAAAADALLALSRSGSATVCTAGYLGYWSLDLTPGPVWLRRGVDYLDQAVPQAPLLSTLWIRRAGLELKLGNAQQSLATIRAGLRHAEHTVQRVAYYMNAIGALQALGDSARAGALQRALAAAVDRDGRPGVRYLYPEYLRFRSAAAAALPSWERAARERLRLALSAGSPRYEWSAQRTLGSTLSDAGRPEEALSHLDRAVRLADSLGEPLMLADVQRFRGRTYAKLGRFADAQRDLREAITAGRSLGEPYLLAESYHNLAHVYEGMGRMAEASRAVDQFIALTRPMQHAQPRMMSLHDAGIIRWKAGWPAAANAAFEQMVRVADEQGRGWYWAGEYFERIGDLPRALGYFERGAAADDGERSLNLGGTARVFRALGKLDSAERAAREHDRVMSNQIDTPLLPAILAAAGRVPEALAISKRWADQQIAQGNLQGAAMATNGLAELLLDAGNFAAALTEAAAAEQLASRVNLTEELITARRLRGSALLRQGDSAGLTVLREASALAEAHRSMERTLSTRLALADGLAASGQADAALHFYDAAARAVEAAAVHINRDLDQIEYRDRQLAAFERATELLLRVAQRPERTAELLAWSERRKAASLALAAGSPAWRLPAGARRLLSLEQVHGRLDSKSALVDYLAVRGTLAALVVTRDRAAVIPLPLSSDTLARLVEQLRRPLVRAIGGRLDLARAPFDLRAAQQLYGGLFAPLDSLLQGIEHLFIVPDGPLHYVPFDALVQSRSDRSPGDYLAARYAVDRFEIELLPSAQFLPDAATTLRTRLASAGTTVLVVQRDAPGGEEEVAGIRAAWPRGSVQLLEGRAATETAARDAGARFSVLHFAVHAEADDREPLASHLLLGSDPENDGFLHLGEIASERRPSQLVVLSACETLSGRLYRGEGMMGLARAFLAGGAQAVVATQWPVGPATAQLMTTFHREYAASGDAAASLHAARLSLRRQAQTAHPFFWGGFVLVRGASAAARAMASPRLQAGVR